jgi:hypothetical protein
MGITTITDSEFDWSDGAEYRDTTFLRCRFSGPAILDVRDGFVRDSLMDYTPGHRTLGACITYSDMQPPEGLPHVRLRGCEFSACEFTNVWMWAPRSAFPKSRLAQWWFMRRHFTFHNVHRKIYRGKP